MIILEKCFNFGKKCVIINLQALYDLGTKRDVKTIWQKKIL